uniref:28S ribosomal protein S18c, mitochondrial n=1 Tax=Caenorhabditis tropicalis TaxID=1561998 RepID=A0A1I7TV30_9PELO
MLKSASTLARKVLITPQAYRWCSSSKVSQAPPVVCSEDEPVKLENNPYTKEPRKCLLCSTGIELDYKNARLLQQFVSTFSGRVYDRHITGLCDEQQKKLIKAIAKSRRVGFMPIFVKDPKYARDPKLFDPLKPLRPHSFA